jgi:regulator of replication initiation timing
MLQLSKIKKSRDEWKEKAKKKTKELWEMRKVLKYYRNRVANLVGENKRLRAELSVPSKAKAVKLDNPAQAKVSHQSETELHRLGGNK